MSKLVEEWRDIAGYEGLYQVSDWGNVRSLDRIINTKKKKRRYKGRMLKLTNKADGYVSVNLWKNGKNKNCTVHRLVANAFIPNPENKEQVGHLKKLPDGTEDKTANEVWNLAWMTPPENSNFGTRNERISKSQKGRVFTEEHKKNLSESIKKSERWFNAVHSKEYREKLSKLKKGKQLNRKDLSQPVYQYTLDGVFIALYPSAKQAARELGVGQCNISRCCNGGFFYKDKWINITQAYGFIWKKASTQQ